jgi:AraC-like DNA-binding protein
MTYLTHWRLALAADLLHQRDVTLTAVARQLGYSDGFALSTAFKRVRGVSPEQYRSKPRDRVGVSARVGQGPGWRGR